LIKKVRIPPKIKTTPGNIKEELEDTIFSKK
jgi:hypothetical protein